jgi:hypothetical protein
MQLRACLGLALLALGACAEIPKGISIWVDGSSLDLRRKQEAEPAPEPGPARPEPAILPADDPQR